MTTHSSVLAWRIPGMGEPGGLLSMGSHRVGHGWSNLAAAAAACYISAKIHGGSDGKASACNVEDPGSLPGSGRSPGEGHGNPLQYSRLENPTDRGAWWATVHRVAKSWTQLKQFSMHAQVIYSLKFSCLWSMDFTKHNHNTQVHFIQDLCVESKGK